MRLLMRIIFQSCFLVILLMSPKGFALDAYIRGGDFSSYLSESDHYTRKVQPIFDKRCVVCHSCFEAPCQLKLTSYAMLERGANQHSTTGGILSAAPRTDLDYTKEQQEKHEFFSVTKDGGNSIMLNLLIQGRDRSNLPKQKYVDSKKFQCIDNTKKLQSLDLLTQKSLGMPYYMSPIPDNEYQILASWLASGAKPPAESVIENLAKPKNPKIIQEWEDFFNNPSWKGRWTSRYLYEHLFTAHLYVEDSPGEFYELVRSYNPAPMKISIISTERPFTMEKGYENNFYYRLKKVTSTIIDKQHFVYRLNADIMAELKNSFWHSKWEGDPFQYPFNFKNANPFVAFKHIPGIVRYKWMLKNSKMLLDMDMRSDNCHGKGATGPLRDNFLVLFIKPESDVTAVGENFYDKANPFLSQANTKGTTGLGIEAANLKMNLTFSSQQEKYSVIKQAYQKKHLKNGLSLEDIWDGEKGTQTPIYTILRHDKTVSVHEGQWGPVSRIALLWDYASFERLYYNCVALTTLYDSINDKAGTVTYLRKVGREVEEQFLSLIPEEHRGKIRTDWVQGLGARQDYDTSKFILPFNKSILKKGLVINPQRPYTSFITFLFTRSGVYSKKSVGSHFYPTSVDTPEYAMLKNTSIFMSTEQVKGEGNRGTHFPNISYIVVKGRDSNMRYYTMIVSRVFEFVNVIDMMPIGKKLESGRLPKKDHMMIFENVVANYPTKIYRLNEEELPRFVNRMKQVNSREDYVAFDEDYGLQKLSNEFWPLIDKVQSHYIQSDVIDNGQLDLIDYGNHDLLGEQ